MPSHFVANSKYRKDFEIGFAAVQNKILQTVPKTVRRVIQMRIHIHTLIKFFIFMFGLGATIIAAQAADWKTTKTSRGVEKLVSGKQWVAVKPGMVIYRGETIRTGKGGRIQLKRNQETMALGPNSFLTLSVDGNGSGTTSVHQLAGKVTYTVERKNVKHFAVHTPYLAAVVKGTIFTVQVGQKSSSVSVQRGVVEVGDYDTGQFTLVKRGKSASTRHQAGAGLTLKGIPTKSIKTRGISSSPVARSMGALQRVLNRKAEKQANTVKKIRKWNASAGYRGHGYGRINNAKSENQGNTSVAARNTGNNSANGSSNGNGGGNNGNGNGNGGSNNGNGGGNNGNGNGGGNNGNGNGNG